MRIQKIMKIIKFEMKIMKIKTNLRISIDSYENHEKFGISRETNEKKTNYRIPYENYENHENHRIAYENPKNNKTQRIQCECHENHENI